MKQSLLFLSLLLCCSMLFATSSHALGKRGHQLVCDLAYQQLDTSHQQAVDSLIGALSQKEKQAINRYLKRSLDREITFADSCVWADAIKKHKAYKRFNAWHYINVGRDAEQITTEACVKDCITVAIASHYSQLSSASSVKQKRQALMFLGHWLGDIHQPLHVSFASDLGGNRRMISQGEFCQNLHHYWDVCLLPRSNKQQQAWQAELNEQWQQQSFSWSDALASQWANESFSIVRQPSVLYCQQSETGCLPYQSKTIPLPTTYFGEHQPIMKNQVRLAAQRLNRLISLAL